MPLNQLCDHPSLLTALKTSFKDNPVSDTTVRLSLVARKARAAAPSPLVAGSGVSVHALAGKKLPPPVDLESRSFLLLRYKRMAATAALKHAFSNVLRSSFVLGVFAAPCKWGSYFPASSQIRGRT